MKQAGGVLGEGRDLERFLQKTTLVMAMLPQSPLADPVLPGCPGLVREELDAAMLLASQQ